MRAEGKKAAVGVCTTVGVGVEIESRSRFGEQVGELSLIHI